MLIDSGPLVALVNTKDAYHARCVAAARTLPPAPLVTTWPCFTEAMYFLYQEVGYQAQQELWQLRRLGKVILHELSSAEGDRMEVLMHQYRDTPMDLADASLVVTAETLGLFRIFTIDSHFHAFRIHTTGVFQVIP